MSKDHLGDFDTFYEEISAANDYLSGFDTDIEDHVDEAPPRQGLAADQVPRLAQDTMHGKEIVRRAEADSDGDKQSLFEDEA